MNISILSSSNLLIRTSPLSSLVLFSSLSSVSLSRAPPHFRALRTGAERTGSKGGEVVGDSALLRKPLIPSSGELVEKDPLSENSVDNDDDDDEAHSRSGDSYKEKEDEWVDWEDQILEDTVPLVGFVRMILHSGKYESGERLSAEHEKIILERVLPYHPELEKKIGCGIDYIIVGYHPEFENSRCLFIVRKDGEVIDFSYWKCIKGLIRKNYPLYADTFILRHFRRRRRGGE